MDRKPKLVSVVVPVYNAEKTLTACVDSILNQTYPNIEIILVDDGSTDKSSEIIEKYKKTDPKQIISLKQKNSGAGRARNHGLDEANGEYILFVDSDDYIDSDYVATLVNALSQGDADCVVSGFRRVTRGGKVLFTRKVSNKEWGKYSTILMCGRAYNKEALRREGIRFLENNIGEDVYMNLLVNLKLKTVVINFIGYNWVDNSSSVSNTQHKGMKPEINFIRFLEETYNSVFTKEYISDKERVFLEYFFIKTCIYYILSSGRGVQYEILEKQSNKIISWLKANFPMYQNNPLVSPLLPRGEKIGTRFVVWLYVLLQKLRMEKILLKFYSNL